MSRHFKPITKTEDPDQYAKLANEGLLLGYPVKIGGQSHRPDNGIQYHSSIKFFDPIKDHAHSIHNLAQHLPLNPPDVKNTQIEPGQFKDRLGNDVFVIKIKGNSAEKIKEHNGKFAHMGFPSTFKYTPYISVPQDVHDKIKSSGAKTAHEASIEFGSAELKRGPQTLKTYHHEPDTTEPRVPDEGDMTAKLDITKKSEQHIKEIPLMKPYVSEAQRRWAHTNSGKKALGGNAGVHEWDETTKGKKLPEKVSKSCRLHKADVNKIPAPPKSWIKSHKKMDAGKIFMHSNGQSMKVLRAEHSNNPGEKHSYLIRQHGFGVGVEKSEDSLKKGILQNAGVALGMAGALAGSAHGADIENRAPASIHQQNHKKAPSYDHKKMLNAIAQVESSGGKNLNHKPTSAGTAYGKYALMPHTIQDTIKGHKDLRAKYGKALALSGDQLHKFMVDNKGLEDIIADRHLSHIEHNFKNDPEKIGFSWNQGITGTKKAKNGGFDISNHPYVKKLRDAYVKGN